MKQAQSDKKLIFFLECMSWKDDWWYQCFIYSC